MLSSSGGYRAAELPPGRFAGWQCVTGRNDRVRSGVLTEAVEDVLICANQTELAGDNLVSVHGAEEDGVDNRVEAPSRQPGESSESSNPGGDSDGAAAPADSAAGERSPAGEKTVVGEKSAVGEKPTAGAGGPSRSADSSDQAQTASARPSQVTVPAGGPSGGRPSGGSPSGAGPSAAGPSAAGPSAAGPSAALRSPAPTQQVPTQQVPSLMSPGNAAGAGSTGPMAAVSGAASSARGLAAKFGSSVSGLSKPKPPKGRPKPKPKQPVRRPGGLQGSGLPPRPQQPVTRPQESRQESRSALLTLQRIEPMSVMKFSFLLSLVGWVVLFIAVAVVYFSLSKLGVFAKIEQTVGLVTFNKNHPGANAASWFRASRVLEYTALVCTVNAILFTALATVGAALYNLVTSLTGGVEVTLRESD